MTPSLSVREAPLRVPTAAFLVVGLALTLGVPWFIKVGNAPVFVLQVTVVAVGVLFYALRHRTLALTFLDHVVLLYLAWILISFVANFPILLALGRADLVRNQVVSLATVLFTMSPYLLGRAYFQRPKDVDLFVRWTALSNLMVLLAVGFFFLYYMGDLYTARQITAQRIPMMLTFLAWAICGPALWDPRQGKLRLFLWLLAIVVIASSLTRAAYLQWAVSAAVFLGISLRRGWLAWRPTLLVGGVMLGVAITGLMMWKSEEGDANIIVQRASQLLTVRETLSGDESATARAEIWRRLGDNLKSHPFHMLFGYGQLGPSAYIGGAFTSVSGEFVNAYNAHNQHLDTLVRAGIFGAFLELLLFAMVTLKPLAAGRNQPPGMFQAHSAALFGVFVYGMFHETIRWQMFGLYFWLYAGMVSYHYYSWKPHAERRQHN